MSFGVSLGCSSLPVGSFDGLVLSGFSTSLGLLSDGCSGVDSLGCSVSLGLVSDG